MIEELALPYTNVHVALDDFFCLPYHWALSKIKTYSIQNSPFIHIDGDIYLPNGLPERLLEAALVAQNKERGTSYYRRMMDGIICCPQVIIPGFAKEGITRTSVPSYNMGIFGGTDLEFIHKYCHEAFQFIDNNHLNNPKYSHVGLNCNVFVEQVLFAIIAERENRQVTTLLNMEINDNGYSKTDFCDFLRFESRLILHVLGGHKRRQDNYLMLEKTLLHRHPEYYKRIMAMFPENYSRPYEVIVDQGSGSSGVCLYDEFLREAAIEWRNIKKEELFNLDYSASQNITYFSMPRCEQERCLLFVCPYLILFNCQQLSEEDKNVLKKRLDCEELFPLHTIAIKPTLTGNRIVEVPLLEEEANMIMKLKSSPAIDRDVRKHLTCGNMACNKLSETIYAQTASTLLRNGLIIMKIV